MERKLLIYGDSNTYGYDPTDYYESRYPVEIRWTTILQELLGNGWRVLPEGMNGRTLPDLRYDRERLIGLVGRLSENDVFAVMLGTNDILLTTDPDAGMAVRKMDAFLNFLTGRMAPGNVLVIAPPYIGGENVRDPLYQRYREESRDMNAGFKKLADQYGTMFLDAAVWGIGMSYDMVHYSEEGHRLFAEKMAEYLGKVFREDGHCKHGSLSVLRGEKGQ